MRDWWLFLVILPAKRSKRTVHWDSSLRQSGNREVMQCILYKWQRNLIAFEWECIWIIETGVKTVEEVTFLTESLPNVKFSLARNFLKLILSWLTVFFCSLKFRSSLIFWSSVDVVLKFVLGLIYSTPSQMNLNWVFESAWNWSKQTKFSKICQNIV